MPGKLLERELKKAGDYIESKNYERALQVLSGLEKERRVREKQKQCHYLIGKITQTDHYEQYRDTAAYLEKLDCIRAQELLTAETFPARKSCCSRIPARTPRPF